jgi:uncharacterized protein (TIGR03435 family)
MCRQRICAALASFTTLTMLVAQQPAFEAVSIKPADPSSPAHMTQQTPGGYHGRNIRLFELIMGAWHLNRGRIAGGPAWLETAGWDIDARLPAGTSAGLIPQMMQAMLENRFHLASHFETRTLPVYTLTVAKGGPKLKPAEQQSMSAGMRFIRYGSASMADLASQLSSYLGREVTDQTGLTGFYNIDLSFAPVDPGTATADDSAPSIFQALQDQAGLKLDSGKGPVQVLVIDRAEKPTPN